MEKGTKVAAEAAGFGYVLIDQKSNELTMCSSTQDLLNQGISALIIAPFKLDALGPIVDAAKEKKIPVVIDDIGGGGTAYDAIVISDNEKGGVTLRTTSIRCSRDKQAAGKSPRSHANRVRSMPPGEMAGSKNGSKNSVTKWLHRYLPTVSRKKDTR